MKGILAVGLVLSMPTITWAACPNAAPSCASGGVGANVCQLSGSTWTCDITRDGGSGTGSLVAVYNTGSLCTLSGTKYCAFGTAIDGGTYCCALASAPNSIVAIGGPNQDWLQFNYFANLTQYDLTNDGPGHTLQAEARANQANDYVIGSHSTSAGYSETLKGGSGDDEIDGHDGDDVCYGDEGDDFMAGGEGDDWMDGGRVPTS